MVSQEHWYGEVASVQMSVHVPAPDGERWIFQSILYTDRYVRRGDRWYFARHRRHRLWYGAEAGVNPLTLPPANWPEHHDGMGDVPAAAFPTWTRYWEGQS